MSDELAALAESCAAADTDTITAIVPAAAPRRSAAPMPRAAAGGHCHYASAAGQSALAAIRLIDFPPLPPMLEDAAATLYIVTASAAAMLRRCR